MFQNRFKKGIVTLIHTLKEVVNRHNNELYFLYPQVLSIELFFLGGGDLPQSSPTEANTAYVVSMIEFISLGNTNFKRHLLSSFYYVNWITRPGEAKKFGLTCTTSLRAQKPSGSSGGKKINLIEVAIYAP